MSSSEDEYVAEASSTCIVLWLRKLLADLHQEQKRATNIFCDVDAEGVIELNGNSTEEQVVDILIKALLEGISFIFFVQL